ncbi:cyclic peptide export ABC transporter [Fulvivirga ligni]|uniref:cyclic peptide export ABC transporter n=1 Tax=Fulvivirga ligni TaxID=2904246 RepID=UPI001F1B0C2C|nr:cyclic peptide export ABC transporter [Fulvivirga ligni]UII23757.1 cyclic peptide export ABC transporter [Fulvivirga ligni]
MGNIPNYLYIFGGLLILVGVSISTVTFVQFYRKKRSIQITARKVYHYLGGILLLLPLFICVYFIPVAFYDENFWNAISVRYDDIKQSMMFFSFSLLGFYLLTASTSFFPHYNKYYNEIPPLLILSLFPGVANSMLVMIITNFINSDTDVKYLLFFFALCTYVYIITVRLSKRKAAYIGTLVAGDLNVLVLRNIFDFSYIKFEKIKSSKIYTILNDDLGILIGFSKDLIRIYTSVVMALIVLAYLFSLNLLSSLLLVLITGLILGFHYLVSNNYVKALHYAKEQREHYMDLVMGLASGFKELVLHGVKRSEYHTDLEGGSADYYNADLKTTNININKILFSDLSFIIAIGATCLMFPLIFNFSKELVTSYVIATLFLWSPFNTIINAVPQISQVQVSWKRISDFLHHTAAEDLVEEPLTLTASNINTVNHIMMKDVSFNYKPDIKNEDITYGIGPINFEADKGEIVFIIGGNGSGKTTFLKILIGLYKSDKGQILINGQKINYRFLGEYFSVIYSDFYLFKKIYGIKYERLEQVYEWLDTLGLADKVKIEHGSFSTLDLSQGQRKRLAILKSYLEDRPIYFFDECAADLDPDFKEFFYYELLPKMRDEGKVLISITHDEKYFDVANRCYKMEMGKMKELSKLEKV